MAQTLILWGHALAALLFGALALRHTRRSAGGLPRRALVVALACTALWALAVAGIDPSDIVTRIAWWVRNLAWLGLVYAVIRRTTGGWRLVTVALGLMWAIDLVLLTAGPLPALVAARGLVLVVVAALLAAAVDRGGEGSPQVSRAATLRLLSVAAAALYVGTIVALTNLAAAVAGDQVRVAQTGIVFGATAALLTLLSTPWLRAWAKVKVAKHLFAHRYDYRAEWQRFTQTLGRPGEGEGASLGQRVVKAVANLTDSPAGLLLVPQGAGLGVGAAWNREEPDVESDERLADHLRRTGRIVGLDQASETTPDPAIPAWMLAEADAWAIVPLVHGEALAGAVLLARPPVPRALDWEDFDLLRVAGRQAASYLAEDRARAALTDAERFDEFNRRFAFILHDIKNLASQQSLVARNAERHAENPAFRADMIATLKDSATRMTALLTRLSQHGGGPAQPPRPVDVSRLLGEIAAIRRSQHPVMLGGTTACPAQADPARLEQVLLHLVQNAVEASGPMQPVTLSCETVNARVAIDVTDTGAGMSPAFVRDQLFRPFVSSKPGGFGIGAYEARLLVEAMGGTLEVASREREGTRFRILLPRAVELEAAA